ncbi:MAG TPA: glycoside hydrolase family 16 protein [Williamwhitmania sp.]|nr:glycoside hydrolase family 16 protein [Williamwhitmania sp.]
MANSFYWFRYVTSRTLGMLPSAEAYEGRINALLSDVKRYKEVDASSKLTRLNELKTYVSTVEFAQRRRELKNLTYKGSSEFKAENRLHELQRDARIKKYFSFKQSTSYATYLKVKDSKDIARFFELKSMLSDQEFIVRKKEYSVKNTNEYKTLVEYKTLRKHPHVKKHLKGKEEDLDQTIILRYEEVVKIVSASGFHDFLRSYKWKNSEYYALEQEFKLLSNNADIRIYLKVDGGPLLKNLDSIEAGNLLVELAELEQLVGSADFREKKKYLLSKDKFEQSEDYKLLQEFKQLEKDVDLLFLFKEKRSGRLAPYLSWELTFLDNFDEKKLDKNRWLTRYFWGEALLHKGYSLSGERQHLSDGNNVHLENSLLTIETRKEKANGMVWDEKLGFFPKEFSYTSGLVSTGQSFRQAYGRFEAKVRLQPQFPVFHAFWMVGDKMLPQLNIFKFGSRANNFEQGLFHGDESGRVSRQTGKLSLPSISGQFAIFTVDWTPKSIDWKVNGVLVRKETKHIPSYPMYLVFSSGLGSDIDDGKLPVSMEVDWVRAFSFGEKA